MNSAAACDQFLGDAKKKPPTNLINDWVLQGMTSSSTTNRTLICHPPAQQNCVVPPGGGTVIYSYVVTNHSAATVTGITLIDIDDKNNTVAQDGPFDLAKGASATFTSTATITTNTTNVVTVSGNGGLCQATDTATVTAACVLGYPFASDNPKTSIAFNESGVLRAFQPDFAGPGDTIRVFYNDEHALTLGVRSVVVKSTTTSTTPYTVTAMTANPDSKTNPSVGTTALTGDAAGVDLNGRPMYPALFITDLTILGDTSKAGDWQFGGTAIPPHFVSGTWKAAVKTIDKTKSSTTTITPDADPATKNNFVLGPGSDKVPAGLANEGYGAEVRWNVNDLRVNLTTGTASTNPADPALSDPALKGHTFRMQFMVHDGDQNKTGGDVGQACVNVAIP